MSDKYPLEVEIDKFISNQSRRFRYSHDWLKIVTFSVRIAACIFVLFGTVGLAYLAISFTTFSTEPQSSLDGMTFAGLLAAVCVLIVVYALRIHKVFYSRLQVSDRFLIFLDQMTSRNFESAYHSALGITEVAWGARDLETRNAFSMAVLILVDSFGFDFKDEYLTEAIKNLSLLEGFSMGNRFVYWGITRLLICQKRFSEARGYLSKYKVESILGETDPHYEALAAMILAGEVKNKEPDRNTVRPGVEN